VYVYGATPEVVYVGYTPGYMGAFVSDGVVVFGTGWRYPGWCGDFWPFYCYGWPWTWGLGFQFSYWGDGWFWRPVHHAWWYHDGPIAHRVFSEHWNPRWNTPNRTWIRGNIDAYNHWGRDAVARRDFGTPAQRRPGITRPDVYAGRDGQVYQPRRDGWYRPDGAGQWRRTTPSPQIQNRLEQQRQSRSLGESRQREFGNRGQAPGIPRTTAPMPRTTAPQSRPSGPQPRAPSSPRGRGRG
jgi:hypothetical protein